MSKQSSSTEPRPTTPTIPSFTTSPKIYRDLVQRELSELEDVPNLWKTEKYCGNKYGIQIARGDGFGGYCDWAHPEFDAKISIRQDCADNFEIFKVGTYGLCISCGRELSHGLLCDHCNPDEKEFCQECDEYFLADEVSLAVDAHGNSVYVCDDCRAEEVPA